MPATVRPTLRVLALVAAGGAIGSAARVGIIAAIPSGGFPWGTLAVNLLGAAAVGALLPRARGHTARMGFLIVGIGGAATTFSALAVEAITLADGGRAVAAAGYLALTISGGFLATWAGVAVGRR